MIGHCTFLYNRTSKYLDLVHGRRRPEVISEQSPYSGGHQVILVITWTFILPCLEIGPYFQVTSQLAAAAVARSATLGYFMDLAR